MQAEDKLIINDRLAEDHGPSDRSNGFKMPTESLGSVDRSGSSDPGGVGNDSDGYKPPVPEATATDGPALLGLKLYGGDDDDTLNGGLFHDKLYGGGGDDTLNGGANGDLLDGGPGQDVLTGGPGGDTFVFGMDGYPLYPEVWLYEHESTVSNPDYINDFSQAEGDKIDLFEINFYTTMLYGQGLDFIGDDAFSGTAGEVRYEVFASKNYTAITGDTDGDGQADFRINIAGNIDFVASDFLLV